MTFDTGFLILAIVLVAASPVHAQTRLTENPWDEATSAEAEKQAARLGNPTAQLSLARRYEVGDGLPSNPDLAADYAAAAALVNRTAALPVLRRLATGGNVRAQAMLGRLLLAEPESASRDEGMRLLTRAGDAGSGEANFILGTRLAVSGNRGGAEMRFVQAERAGGITASFARFLRENLHRAARQNAVAQLTDVAPVVEPARFDRGEPRLERSLAYWGLTRDNYYKTEATRTLVALRLFDLAEATYSGDVVADYLFVRELHRRCGEEAKMDRWACAAAVDASFPFHDLALYEGRAHLKDMPKVLEAGKVLEVGVGGPADHPRARALYELLVDSYSDAVIPEPAFRLSQMLDQGLGGPVDKARARMMLEKAAEYRQPVAAFAIALEKMRQNDMDGLAFYLRAAADGGNADAAYYYARLLSENRIRVRWGQEHIFKYFQQAADAGHRQAFYAMGEVYWNGWGAQVDKSKAEYWWQAAARLGDPKAADHVATLFSNRSDWAGAIPWLRRAAQGGYPGAQGKLDRILAGGYRERNLGGFLLGVFDFMGDLGESMAASYQAQYEAEQAEIRRAMSFYVLPSADPGGSGSGISDSASIGLGSDGDVGNAVSVSFAGDSSGGLNDGSSDGGGYGGSNDYVANSVDLSGAEDFDSQGSYAGSWQGGNLSRDGETAGINTSSSSASSGSSDSTSGNFAITVESVPITGPSEAEIAAQQRAAAYEAQQTADRAALARSIKESLDAQAADLRDFETNPCRNTFPAPASCYPNASEERGRVSPQ